MDEASTSNGGSGLAQPAMLVPGHRIQRKIYMPVKDIPGRNFIGLIIGPRGNTQKRLEAETGCKISIRGKVGMGAGRQARPKDEADELHVIISGDSDEAVDLAAQNVDKLLRPMDDQDNVQDNVQDNLQDGNDWVNDERSVDLVNAHLLGTSGGVGAEMVKTENAIKSVQRRYQIL